MLRFLVLLFVALAAAPAAAQGAFTSDRIGVTVTGSGPDVILIPGLSSSPDVWRSTIAAVPGYRYHLIHVSGFAGRPAGANASGPVLAPVAEEIARYIAEAHLDHPALVGHSMGGSWALMVAGRHPGLAGKVMVVDMMPYVGAMFRQPDMTDEQFDAVAQQIRASLASAGGEQRRIALGSMIASMVKTDSERPAILAHSLASDPMVSAQAFYEVIVTNLLPEIAAIHVPIMVLYVQPAGAPLSEAQIDGYYSASYRAAPQAVLRRIPNSYHFIMLDQPVVFQTALREFLAAPAPAAH